jgi:hypothetical protein
VYNDGPALAAGRVKDGEDETGVATGYSTGGGSGVAVMEAIGALDAGALERCGDRVGGVDNGRDCGLVLGVLAGLLLQLLLLLLLLLLIGGDGGLRWGVFSNAVLVGRGVGAAGAADRDAKGLALPWTVAGAAGA